MLSALHPLGHSWHKAAAFPMLLFCQSRQVKEVKDQNIHLRNLLPKRETRWVWFTQPGLITKEAPWAALAGSSAPQ